MLTIGVDAHKRSWVAVAVDESGRPVGQCAKPAGDVAAAELIAWATAISPSTGVSRWGIEGAMHYGRSLAQCVLAAGMRVYEVPGQATARERRRSRGRLAEKSDHADALAIARVVLRDAADLPPVAADDEVSRCRALSEHRDNLVLARTAALNQLYAHQGHTEPTAKRPSQGRRNRLWLARIASSPLPAAGDPLAAARHLIQQQHQRSLPYTTS